MAGLFDKILKEGSELLKDVASEENKEKASELLGSLKDALGEHAESLKEIVNEYQAEKKNAKPEKTVNYEPEDFEEVEDGKTCREKILEVLASEFSNYTVKENVSPTTLGGTGRFMDYSIVVYDNDKPALIMMLIGKTTTYHREYRWSREVAEKNGYAFINFIEHYPNRPESISKRLHQYL